MVRSGPRRPANKNSPGRLPVAFGKSSTAWRVARSISNLTGGPVFFCRVSGDRLRTRRQLHPRLFINPPAGPASDHVRLRHGVPGLAFWRQCRVLPPTRNLPALASSLAGRRSGSTGRGEASSRLTGTIGWMLRQRPAIFRPPGGNGLLKPDRSSDVVLGRNVVFLQSRKRL
jgi:hypothetical protein